VRATPKTFCCLLVLTASAWLARGDWLVTTNGERFVGAVIEENATNVVFDSELAGRVVFPQSKIRDLQRTPLVEAAQMSPASAVTNAPTNALVWKPPGVGIDGSDWVQLKSGEWLRGEIKYIQDKDVEFDSDELEMQTLKLKDVKTVYTAHRMYTRFNRDQPVYGNVVISNDVVMVNSEPPVSMSRNDLIGITPGGGQSGLQNWSGDASLGLSLQSGNNTQTTLTTSAELARRTPGTTFLINYLGNYSQVNDVQSADNQRVNTTFDIRLNQDWFVRPVQLEYYQDTLANISYRLTGGVGGGYYIFDRTGLEWNVSVGPSYQYTRFETVEPGQDDSATTPAGVFNSYFKGDITSRLTFIQSWQSMFTDEKSGQYNHHAVSTLEFEIKKHLDLDVSFIWDYLQNPETKSDGVVPQKSDYYLTVGFGVRF
jgi:Protein of unknown function, DUF481